MRSPCPLINQRVLIGKPDWQQAILARHMTGAFMSGAEKLQWSQVETGLCPLCGGKDTKIHRLFSCPALSDIRAPYMALLHTVQADFPEWVHMFAATEHDKQGMLRLITSARQLPPLVQTSYSGRVTLFTDGSALHSNCPPARLTYWSVVCSSLDCDSPDLAAWARLPATTRALQFRVLVQGSTPGCQTIPRAELAAVAWCADWLLARPTLQATLYTDSAYVMHVWAILSGRCPLQPLAGDLDLTASLALLGNTGRLDIRKVKAHNSAGLAWDSSPLLRFASEGNVAADAAARQARTQECELVRQVAEDIFEHYQYQLDHAELFAGYLVELNVAEQRRKEAATGRHDITPVYDEARARRDFFARPAVPLAGDTFRQHCGPCHRLRGLPFGDEFMRSLHRWAGLLDWPNLPLHPAHVGSITFLELCVHFCVATRTLPPIPLYGSKQRRFISLHTEAGRLQHVDVWVLVSTFQEAVETLCRSHSIHLLPASRIQQLPNLRALGLKWDLPGISVRPILQQHVDFDRILSAICETGNIQSLLRFCSGVD